ncbi:MAG TPA: outer membrane protein assembly factor BamD [Blastocatellia bacterium]|nr:outer membrane protein assembly factor BamD [Blastocatellia bacterium]
MKLRSIVIIVAASVLALAGCGPKDKVKNENAPVEGRDRELYDQAKKKAEKGRYDEARLLYNVVITTYPDSLFLPLAKLSIADTFYLEGGTSNLQQAIGGYKDFAQYFPTHPQICAVKRTIAQAYMRQMGAYNRDVSNAKQAEHQLKAAEQTCRNSPILPKIQSDLVLVQQNLALHELDIARFYIDKRQAYKSGESRLRDIVNNYPFFSYYDESLYRLGVSLVEQEQPEEAAEYFTRLVRDFSKSDFAPKGKEYLEKLGKPIPEPSNNNAAPERPSFMGKVKLIMGNNGLEISEDGVLLSKKGQEKEEVRESVKTTSEGGAQPGARAVRASTKGKSTADQSDANPTSTTPNGSTNVTPNGANGGASDNQTTTPAPKSGEPKKEGKKDSKKKEKKGFLGGIFK